MIEDFDNYGLNKNDFEIVSNFNNYSFDINSNIVNWFLENWNKLIGKTFEEIVDIIQKDTNIKTTVSEVINLLKNINNTVLNVSTIGNKIETIKPIEDLLPQNPINKNIDKTNNSPVEIQVVYDFVLRSGVKGTLIKDNSSPFCKMVGLSNKYFTKMDIQKFSVIVGWDVFEHGFHFWIDENGVMQKNCRHTFKPVVIRKKNNSETKQIENK